MGLRGRRVRVLLLLLLRPWWELGRGEEECGVVGVFGANNVCYWLCLCVFNLGQRRK